ncbi:MAG: acyltransferase family protein [Syntrophobacteraceae bacterium]
MISQYLNTLRGLAAISILLTHWDWGGLILAASLFSITFWANNGLHPGVIFFVVLSGFLIHTHNAETSPNLFYKKRVLRIFPVYLFGIALGCCIPLFWSQPGFFMELTLSILMAGALVPHGIPPGNQILDTIEVLFWAYMAYPVLLKLRRKSGWGIVLMGTILLHLAAVALVMRLDANSAWVRRSFYVVFLYWVIGVLAADMYSKWQEVIKSRSVFLLLASITLRACPKLT